MDKFERRERIYYLKNEARRLTSLIYDYGWPKNPAERGRLDQEWPVFYPYLFALEAVLSAIRAIYDRISDGIVLKEAVENEGSITVEINSVVEVENVVVPIFFPALVRA